jgi:hypothetical protein
LLPHALSVFNASVIIALAQRYRIPNIHAVAEAVAAGGLVFYGINWADQFRRAAEGLKMERGFCGGSLTPLRSCAIQDFRSMN